MTEQQRIALGFWPRTWAGWWFWLRYWSPPALWLARFVQWRRTVPLYYELLYQVATKHPGESRHQTALRYLRQQEAGNPNQHGCDARSGPAGGAK